MLTAIFLNCFNKRGNLHEDKSILSPRIKGLIVNMLIIKMHSTARVLSA